MKNDCETFAISPAVCNAVFRKGNCPKVEPRDISPGSNMSKAGISKGNFNGKKKRVYTK